MRGRSSVVVGVLALAACRSESRDLTAPAVAPSIPTASSWLPTPPQQAAPWRAPPPGPGLPDALISSAAALFEQGLADPRGLAYHEVALTLGTARGGAPATVHAWVLPGGGQRFAVAWSGLVYPVERVGPRQDLAADVRTLVAAEAARLASEAPRRHTFFGPNTRTEAESVSHATLQPLKAVLLLRLGEAALATETWAAWTARLRAHDDEADRLLGDPYGMLATDWTWALYDRALDAHQREDDRLALASARALSAIQEPVERLAARRDPDLRRTHDGHSPYLYFLWQLPRLLADQERRAVRGAEVAGAGDRISGLVRRLDEVRDPWAPDEPNIGALVREGDAAVEPLLAALVSDTRLTRAPTRQHTSHVTNRALVPVHDAAYVALIRITEIPERWVHSTVLNLGRELHRSEMAAELRAYWRAWRGVPVEERWLRQLADDAASVEQWLAAAADITWQEAEGQALRGESLRSRTDRPVTALMVRRLDALGARTEASATGPSSFEQACTMAEHLAAWDPSGGLAAITRQWQRARMRTTMAGPDGAEIVAAAGCLATLTQARLAAADRRALQDYLRWLAALPPEAASWDIAHTFAPLWLHAGDPGAERAVAALLGDPRSPWAQNLDDWLASLGPMMVFRPFRALVLRELADRTPVGTLTIEANGHFRFVIIGGDSGGALDDQRDPRMPAAGSEITIRRCDYVAWQLERVDGSPTFHLYLPEAARDQELAAIAAFVRRYPSAPRR